jgi:hypothetical protein
MKILSIAFALVLFASSWQSYFSSGTLIVHETEDQNSAVCYIGSAEDYDGHCVSPAAPTFQYIQKQEELKRQGN